MRILACLCLAGVLAACVADAPRRPAPEAPAPAAAAPANSVAMPLLAALRVAAPDADPAVLGLALRARQCALAHGDATASTRLAVIDYSRPSTHRRLWVFDLQQQPRLLFAEFVAHGRGSGDNLATRFSNADGSLQSSLGLFATAETYMGEHGYSLRMDGLEPGINDHARDRAIVMHGAWYVDPKLATSQGRLGRSHGCPAVREGIARPMIDALRNGQLLFAYYPDREWLARSRFLACATTPAAAEPIAILHVPPR